MVVIQFELIGAIQHGRQGVVGSNRFGSSTPSLDHVLSTYIQPLLSSGAVAMQHRRELHLCGRLEGEDKLRGRWHEKVGDMDEDGQRTHLGAATKSAIEIFCPQHVLFSCAGGGTRQRATIPLNMEV
jgi:hypothetical protein